MSEQLSTLDAGFLEAEDSDRHVSLAVGGISIIEGPLPDYDSLVAGIAERVLKVPRFSQVLRTHVLDLGPPQWVHDPHLDVAHHIHRGALPHPGAVVRGCCYTWHVSATGRPSSGQLARGQLGGRAVD